MKRARVQQIEEPKRIVFHPARKKGGGAWHETTMKGGPARQLRSKQGGGNDRDETRGEKEKPVPSVPDLEKNDIATPEHKKRRPLVLGKRDFFRDGLEGKRKKQSRTPATKGAWVEKVEQSGEMVRPA